MERILVSACLLGQPVRYDGGSHGPFDLLRHWQAEGRLVPLCPEVAGGRPPPRPPAAIPGGDGAQGLSRRDAELITLGPDHTAALLAGPDAAVLPGSQHHIR